MLADLLAVTSKRLSASHGTKQLQPPSPSLAPLIWEPLPLPTCRKARMVPSATTPASSPCPCPCPWSLAGWLLEGPLGAGVLGEMRTRWDPSRPSRASRASTAAAGVRGSTASTSPAGSRIAMGLQLSAVLCSDLVAATVQHLTSRFSIQSLFSMGVFTISTKHKHMLM